MDWALRFLGVGNASAVELGSPNAVIERDGQPWLAIDCGGEGLTAYQARYGALPSAVFVTHVHLDHVAGFERLFVGSYFNPELRGRIRLYVPATVVPSWSWSACRAECVLAPCESLAGYTARRFNTERLCQSILSLSPSAPSSRWSRCWRRSGHCNAD